MPMNFLKKLGRFEQSILFFHPNLGFEPGKKVLKFYKTDNIQVFF